ncbi:hypothetical protein WN48_02445 [Eufriesea mexicana]|uniref:uncharacterized protein LOC108548863 n=1 Tax=Eufriesea mexicana TaxID=516756 RepID=UPI00083C28A2|nr:PREDICTED: uncharacterized protein LOC108548863 [Eufriesea mexicana]OAD56920.1 hypothetical protein WN48_02445 [Eufriesea mexicana]
MSDRHMKFPYTFAAKLARFPFHYYWTSKRGWVLRYWALSTVLCTPVFYYIQKLSYHPDNVKKWEEIHKKQFSGEMRH